MEHIDIPVGEVHKPHNYEFADAAERLVDNGYSIADVGKFALQIDDHTYWSIRSIEPLAWKQIGAAVTDPLEVSNISASDSLTLGNACDIFQGAQDAFGWRDNIQQFSIKPTGSTPPSYGQTIGNYEGYMWSASLLNQAMVDFHVDHDYAIGTPLYPHVHFRPLTALGGVVRWGFEFTPSKGHGQTVGMAESTTVYVNFTVDAGNLGTHYVAEVDFANAIPATQIEPDTVIHVRVFRDAANAADTYAGTVWAWQADLHYQFARLGTKNKSPNFYA